MTVLALGAAAPDLAPSVFVAPGAVVVGRVTLHTDASLWYSAVLRAEDAPITIGARSNLQDGVVGHTDTAFPLTVGSGVSVGHRAVLHGCTIDDDVLVGMGAVVLNGAHVGAGSLIAAGAVVTQGAEIPPGSLVAGVPGKVRRALTDEERADIRRNAESYVAKAGLHRQALADQ
jgi:carbonic anhydrase/acetyltransferase-like protein (isoleucine patch superfamily)